MVVGILNVGLRMIYRGELSLMDKKYKDYCIVFTYCFLLGLFFCCCVSIIRIWIWKMI